MTEEKKLDFLFFLFNAIFIESIWNTEFLRLHSFEQQIFLQLEIQ